MSKVDFGFVVVLGIAMSFAFGFGWTCGVVKADSYAIAGLGRDAGPHMPSAAIIAHRLWGHHDGANAIGAAAAQHGQYKLSGMFDLAHHAY